MKTMLFVAISTVTPMFGEARTSQAQNDT